MELVSRKDDLTRRSRINAVLNYSFRGIAILLGLLYTRLTLQYFGNTIFGIWSTITAVATWVNVGDLGIGNGLRNELSMAVAHRDDQKQKRLISYSAVVLSIVAVILFVIITIVTEMLFATNVLDPIYRVPMYITNIFFCIDLIFGVARSVAYGLQMSWLTTFAQTSTVVLRTLMVFLLLRFHGAGEPSLNLFAVLNGSCAIIGNIFLILIIMYRTGWRRITSIFRYFDKEYRKTILKLGVNFFIIQISCLVLYSTDNLIINKVLSSEAVTEYDLISKIYTMGENLFSILLISFWSAVTAAAALKKYNWIKREIKKLLKFWLVFSLGVVLVSVLFNIFVKIWLGKNAIHYDFSLIALFATYSILTTFGSIFVNASNGLGRLKIQLIAAVLASIINIPLSIVFATTCNMGIFGVKLATLLCCFGSIVIVPIDIIRYLSKTKDESGEEGGLQEGEMKYYSLALRRRRNNDYFFDKKDFTFKEVTIKRGKRYWYADPFLFSDGKKDYVFYEAFDIVTKKGSIGYSVIEDDDHLSKPKIIIKEKFHLSFPYIFKKNNNLYIMPESSSANKLLLYRCIEFPNKWVQEKVLLKDIFATDSIILDNYVYCSEQYRVPRHDRVVSCWVKNKRYNLNDVGQPGELVLEGDDGVRNAGNYFSHGNDIYRPGQDCKDGKYGRGLVFFRVKNKEPYQGEEVYRIDAPQMQDHIEFAKPKTIIGTHTYNVNDNYEVIDMSYIARKRIRESFLADSLLTFKRCIRLTKRLIKFPLKKMNGLRRKIFKHNSCIYESVISKDAPWIFVSYKTDVFYNRHNERFLNTHQNNREALFMEEYFNSKGFNVCFMDFNSKRVIPKRDYKLIFGHEPNFGRACLEYPNAKKIYYGVSCYYDYRNKKIKEMTDYFNGLYGGDMPYKRIVEPHDGVKLADKVLLIGSNATIDTFPDEYKVKISLIHQSTIVTPVVKEYYSKKSKEFLFLASSGNALKGVGPLITYFINHPEYELHWVGPIENETHKMIDSKITKNIHTYGFLGVGSTTFLGLVERCDFAIYPSGVEGSPGAVLTCCNNGLIPLTTTICAFDELHNFDLYIMKDSTVEEIDKAISWAMSLNNEQIAYLKANISKCVKETFNLERYKKEFADFFDKII